MTSSRAFVDTNVLVYSASARRASKRDIARRLLGTLAATKSVVISTQVLQEFYVVATRKGTLTPHLGRQMIGLFREQFEVAVVTPDRILEAIDCSILNQISFWDALLIASASAANCEELWTEDLNPNQTISGVRIVNPFAEA